MTVEDAKAAEYLREMSSNPTLAWMQPISKSANLFSSDNYRKAILDSINMAWTEDKYKKVGIKLKD
jgi:hypothetical protein